jgi:FeS assembly protein IscX
MRWENIEEIAEALEESHPDAEIRNLRLARLHKWITQLLDFDDDPGSANERVLEAIHEAWAELRDDEEEI